MKTTGLSGKSGTGKSYVATELSIKIGADGIIDDGLLIINGNIVAGKSAKHEKTKIAAVKAAIFTDDARAEELINAIGEYQPSHILILGTSDDMVLRIAERLRLPVPDEIIQIENITTEDEREIARERRVEEGMHTIPAPTFQVRKQFSGYFIDPKKSFKYGENKKDKTVMRPTYSYLGSYEISDRVIEQIVDHVAKTVPACSKMLFAASTNSDDGLYIRIIVNFERGCNIRETAELLQKRVRQAVSRMTSFYILGIEVEIRSFTKST